FFFSSRRRHTRWPRDWSSDVCSSDLPWRGGESSEVAPRVRLLGLSYILVFGAAMVQIIAQPSGVEAEALGGLMVLGGVIVILVRSEEHTSELQSRGHLVCRLLLEKKE